MAFFICFVIAVVALVRTGNQKAMLARLARLEAEIDELRRLLSVPPRAARSDATEGSAAPEAPVPADVQPSSVAAEAVPPEAEPPPIEPGISAAGEPAGGDATALAEPAESPVVPEAPRITIDWERWIGVQGAAVLGGIVLALAGLLFFQYSIEHGLISPTLRVILGTLVGVACVAAPQASWRDRYPDTANALTGAGLVILYASFWAARNLYGLLGVVPAFGLMALVTAAGCVIAVTRSSQLVAILGLVGGFATPFLLSSGANRPIGLFGYVLLLDVALLAISRRHRWPLLAALSLAGTFLYQLFWIGSRMRPDQLALGLAILGIFSILFVVGARQGGEERPRGWLTMRAASALYPFAFVLYLAGHARFGAQFYPHAVLLVLLSIAASWLAERENEPRIAVGAASAGVAAAAAWLLTGTMDASLAWESAASVIALALPFHVFAERARSQPLGESVVLATVISSAGLLIFEVVGSLDAEGAIWPWTVGWIGLAALLVRQGTIPNRAVLQLAGWTMLAAALSLAHLARGDDPAFPSLSVYLAFVLLVSVAAQLSALVQSGRESAGHAERGASLMALVFLLSFAVTPRLHRLPPDLLLAATLAFGFLAALAATRLGDGKWLCGAVGATALVHSAWTFSGAADGASALVPLVFQCAAVVLFTVWPFVAERRFRNDRFAIYAAAVAPVVWFLSLRELFVVAFGNRFIGSLPVALGALSLAAGLRARSLWPAEHALHKTALAWFFAIALGFVSVAIPLQLEKQWVTIGWALEAVAVALLWRRLDHPGLKYFSAALAVAVTVRLIANPEVMVYYPRPRLRLVNWILYAYWVSAASLVDAAAVFRPLEVERLRSWEKEGPYRRPVAIVAGIAGLGAILVFFAWINLAIADWFSDGTRLELQFLRHVPQRDLTTSIAWAIYALLLLGVGMAKSSGALRWLSLGFLLLTIAKVFLYDLGELHDLYRVVSLLGLATSLILVSLGYQRFVFRKPVAEAK